MEDFGNVLSNAPSIEIPLLPPKGNGHDENHYDFIAVFDEGKEEVDDSNYEPVAPVSSVERERFWERKRPARRMRKKGRRDGSLAAMPIHRYRHSGRIDLVSPKVEYNSFERRRLIDIFRTKLLHVLRMGDYELATKIIKNVRQTLHVELLEYFEPGMRKINDIIIINKTTLNIFFRTLAVLFAQEGFNVVLPSEHTLQKGSAIYETDVKCGETVVGKMYVLRKRPRKTPKPRRSDFESWLGYCNAMSGFKNSLNARKQSMHFGVLPLAMSGEEDAIGRNFSRALNVTKVCGDPDTVFRFVEYIVEHPVSDENFNHAYTKLSDYWYSISAGRHRGKKLRRFLIVNIREMTPLLSLVLPQWRQQFGAELPNKIDR